MTIKAKSVGKPLKFKTVEELEEKINAYFAKCEKEGRPLTITGLAVELDTTRETLLDYEVKSRYSDTIQKAKAKIHRYAEESLWRGGGIVSGVIFNLKNNWGWKDTSELTNKHEFVELSDGKAKKILEEVTKIEEVKPEQLTPPNEQE